MARLIRVVLMFFVVFAAAGCGGSPAGPKIAGAGGTVTLKGSPLAGATVTFMPDKGPLAIGVTDLNGQFKLSTGAMAGCATGPAKVTVRVDTPADSSTAPATTVSSSTDSAEQAKKMGEMTMAAQRQEAAGNKSLIPAKYKDPSTSGLEFTVTADSSKNKFVIELQD